MKRVDTNTKTEFCKSLAPICFPSATVPSVKQSENHLPLLNVNAVIKMRVFLHMLQKLIHSLERQS